MGSLSVGRGWLCRGACCVGLVWVLGAVAATRHSVAKKPVVLTPYERAVKDRVEFEGLADGAKSKAAFTRVMDEFRAVYHENPRDTHAADAVNAVAELLAEQGRVTGEEKSLKAAVGQYEFLRAQYPGSSLARLAFGKERGVVGAAREEGRATPPSQERSPGTPRGKREEKALVAGPTHRDETAMNGARKGLGVEGSEIPHLSRDEAAPEMGHPTAKADSSASLRNDKQASLRNDSQASLRNDKLGKDLMAVMKRPLAVVSGIRHWSTPTYTRVAIDLGAEVTFEAARVPHPDRLYFDLHGAKLGAELVGKSFDVTDDGFLKKIRAAQAGGDVIRVVLDVSDVSEYSAFLLPNPYRLIIDIHGAKGPAASPREEGRGKREEKAVDVADLPVTVGAGKRASAAANVSGLPAMAVTDGGEAVRPVVPSDGAVSSASRVNAVVPAPRTGALSRSVPGKPVPNSVAVKAPENMSEVASVSDAPGKVEATTKASTKPVAAVVDPTHRDEAAMNGARRSGGDTKAARASSEAYLGDDKGVAKMGHRSVEGAPTRAAEKTLDGETSLVRALGLKIGRIVIDAGHGGHDSGTLGVDGIQEKDVVLDVALRLGKLLHERLGAEIIYTRSDDTFIPLETRTAIANKAQADLFLSIHANSSQDETARGVETYYLNFTSDNAALDVAARENAVGGQSIHQLSDLVKKITLKDKIAESREFASDVEGSLFAGLTKGNAGLKNRGVKKAPFVVLIGANMPSILAEISFVTNARDAQQLRVPEYRQRVAESLFTGVAKYENGLAGARDGAVVRASVR